MLQRKAMPAHLRRPWETFSAQAERVEAARSALLGCLPVGRVDPAPVPVGLDLLRDELDAVGAQLQNWRVEEMEQHWQAVVAAMQESYAALPEAEKVATSSRELEELLEAVGDVVEPLDAWGDAERAWLRLRIRR